MWRCAHCGEECEDSFEVCWNCGVGRDGSAVEASFKSGESKGYPMAPPDPSLTHQAKSGKHPIISRYSDAYVIARSVSAFGATVKFLALVLGVGISILGFSSGSKELGIGAIGLGVIAGLAIYVLGTIVAAQGQILKATLDTAVNSSQFLTKDEMRKIMSLS